MKGGTRAAVAIGVGYVLGRRRKMRLATVLAVGAATGGIGALGGSALRRGTQALGSTEALSKLSPQLGEIAQTVRGDLIDAGKAAAVAAVSGRVDALTDSLHERAERIRNPAAAAAGAGEAARGATGRRRKAERPAVSDRRRDGRGRPGREDSRESDYDDESEYDESEYDEPEDDEDEYDEPEDDEPEDDEDLADEDRTDEDEAAESTPAPSRRRGPPSRPPVTRARQGRARR